MFQKDYCFNRWLIANYLLLSSNELSSHHLLLIARCRMSAVGINVSLNEEWAIINDERFFSFEISLTTLIPYKQYYKEKICNGRDCSGAAFDSSPLQCDSGIWLCKTLTESLLPLRDSPGWNAGWDWISVNWITSSPLFLTLNLGQNYIKSWNSFLI